ncbi:MAG: hypothetical protein Q8Q14_09040 [Gemmatimonadales bacterium]|nr:hypothetical protein [Gemmatimonadales bacterium]
MGIGSHLKGNWATWLIGAIGLAGTAYFYFQSVEKRDPVFVVDPTRTEIVSRARVETAPIRVLRQDGRPVSADLYAIRFYFWNAGRRSIRPENVLDTIRLTIDSTAEILDYKILKTSRAITAAQLHAGAGSVALRSLVVTFRILERDDGFTGQIMYEGPGHAALRISGLVEGVPNGVMDASNPGWLRSVRMWDTGLFAAIGFLGLVTFGLIALLYHVATGKATTRVDAASGAPPVPSYDQVARLRNRERRPMRPGERVGVSLMLVIMLAFIGFGFYRAFQVGQRDAQQRSVNAVPAAMLP